MGRVNVLKGRRVQGIRPQSHLSEPHRKENQMTKRHWLFASAVLALLLGTSVGFASAKPLGAISVTDSTTAAASAGMTSHFTASGCGFRANDDNYYLVVRGPGLYTTSLTYWTDHFPVGANGCGSASPTWSGSGVTGSFDVYVVRSTSGNPWQAQPASNTLSVYISTP